ncbi:serine acetyltransferase [Saccharopolyspora erythraea]|uniref:serine O-acetyltransferase EpsC n=1 Tax=Saccharopolyspora erythraea TaxID=1836 RepID=UPI001BABD169|nr:serine O-acetyltransferase EpsC [Saccharopolyspora erythraea]QUH03569.1 serine acetyltransferase [Saccharopolyspora erythraea]
MTLRNSNRWAPDVRRACATLREDLDTVLAKDPAVTSRAEALMYPHLLALWAHRAAHLLYRRARYGPARLISLLARSATGIDIHPGARIGPRLFIDHGEGVVIGETATIGADVVLYHQVTLGAVGWRRDRMRAPGEQRHPTVGDGVTIGAKASVLGPVEVGECAVIGAHALVLRDVAAKERVRGGAVVGRHAAAATDAGTIG